MAMLGGSCSKCCGGECITQVFDYSQRMTNLFTVENFNSGEIFKHLQITGIDFTGATASIYPAYTSGRYDTLVIKLANGGEVLFYSLSPVSGPNTNKYGWGFEYCLTGFLNGSTGPCKRGSAGTVPQYATARVEVSISPQATNAWRNQYRTEWYSGEHESFGSPSLSNNVIWYNINTCLDGSDTFIDLNYQLHDPVTVTFTEYMRPRFCGDCLPVCYDTGTEKKCIQGEDIHWDWTTDGVDHPTLADCEAVCGNPLP